jgi:glycosyltransferase involved in cell wall biosynthesis
MLLRKLAIITSHPVQYNAPLFRLLSQQPGMQIKVFYTWEQSQENDKFDPGFGKRIKWDIPLLDGYEYEFIKNIAKEPGTHHYSGIDNPDLIERIQSWQPTALLVFGWSFKSHLACLRFFKGKLPIIFRGDSTLLDRQGRIKGILRNLFLKWVYRYVDYALYVGTNNKNYFLAHGLKEEQLHFAPHAVDNQRFATSDAGYCERALALKEQLGIRREDVVVLFAGKLESKKDPFLLIELASRIDSGNFKFLLVGNGVLETDLKKAAVGNEHILFMDFQNQQQMPVIYRLCDLFILPSRGPGETWGLAVNEAMACKRAVLVSDKAGCAIDLVKEGVNGFIFSPNQVGQCAALLAQLLNDQAGLARMGRSSGELIQSYSFQKVVTAIHDLVTTL